MGAPIFRSLCRPALWAGAERVPAILLTLFSLALMLFGIMGHTLFLLVTGPVLFLAGWAVLRKLAEYDPMAFQVIGRWLFRRSDIYKAVKNIGDR